MQVKKEWAALRFERGLSLAAYQNPFSSGQYSACDLCMQVEKEREAVRFEMNKAAAQMKEADAAIAAQKAELDKLNQIITEADQASTCGPMCMDASNCIPCSQHRRVIVVCGSET